MSTTPIEQLARRAGQAVRDRADQLDTHRPHVDRLRRRDRARRALTAGAAVVVVVAALVAFVQARPGSVPVIGGDASPQPTERQPTEDPTDHDTPEPITDRVRIGDGVYEGGDQPWVMHAWLTEEDVVCIELRGLGCGAIATEAQPLAWLGTSIQSAPEDKGCAYGPIDEQVAAVEMDFSSGETVTLSPLDGQQLPTDFYVYCWEGQRQPTSVRALDETGRPVASTDIQATRELDELIDEQWPAFTGTYRIVEFDLQTGRTQRSHRETIVFASMTDWELRSDLDYREWVRDGQHCTDFPGSGDASQCEPADGTFAPNHWLQPAWPTLIPGDQGSDRWHVERDDDTYTARLVLRRPCRHVVPVESCDDPDQQVDHGYVVHFAEPGIPYGWYEHIDGTRITLVEFTELTIAGETVDLPRN